MRAISSGGNGSPWALAVSVNSGDGQPMWLRSMMSEGRSSSAMPRRMAASSSSTSLAASPMSSTCQL